MVIVKGIAAANIIDCRADFSVTANENPVNQSTNSPSNAVKLSKTEYDAQLNSYL